MPLVISSSGSGRTYQDLQDEVLHNRFNAGKYRTFVARWLNDALQRVYNKLELEAGQKSASLSVASGTRTVDLPTDFNRLARDSAVRRSETAGDEELEERDFASIDSNDSDTGAPVAYVISGSQLYLYPVPDADYSLEIRYWSDAALMESDDDTPGIEDEYSDILVSYATARAYEQEDDPEMAQYHLGRFEAGMRALAEEMQQRGAGPRQVPGVMSYYDGIETGFPLGMRRP